MVVLLEEAGNTHEDKMPLKELHYHLDRPRVATVILTNDVLDAAKMNRCMTVLQMMPEDNVLVRGSLNLPSTKKKKKKKTGRGELGGAGTKLFF